MTTTENAKARDIVGDGRPSVILLRRCDVCGWGGNDVKWVRDPDGEWWSLCRDDNPDYA